MALRGTKHPKSGSSSSAVAAGFMADNAKKIATAQEEASKATKTSCDLATEQSQAQTSQITKIKLFNSLRQHHTHCNH